MRGRAARAYVKNYKYPTSITCVFKFSTLTHRSYVWTLNNPTENDVERLVVSLSESLEAMDGVRYIVCGLEEAPETGMMHLQGYSELSRPMRLRHFQQVMLTEDSQRLHVEPRRGSRDEARTYITDEEKPSSHGWVEAGTWSGGGQGARGDLSECQLMLDSGASMVEIASEHFGTWCRNYRSFQIYATLKQHSSTPAWRQISVKVFFGTSGAGKTRAAFAASNSAFLLGQNDTGGLWYDLYNGEELLILDDFTGWMPLATLLRVLDGYPLRLPTKGSHCIAQWTKVILTSNMPPHLWYNPETMMKHPGALERRVSEIWKYHLSDAGRLTITQVAWGTQ